MRQGEDREDPLADTYSELYSVSELDWPNPFTASVFHLCLIRGSYCKLPGEAGFRYSIRLNQ